VIKTKKLYVPKSRSYLVSSMDISKVAGKNSQHKVFLYTLSTCVWCKMTKKFLKDNDIAFEYVDVDLSTEEEKEQIRHEILKKGGDLTYPTTIVDDKKVIAGFRKDKLQQALGI
jgi:glutaredoxin-like protein NrdH